MWVPGIKLRLSGLVAGTFANQPFLQPIIAFIYVVYVCTPVCMYVLLL